MPLGYIFSLSFARLKDRQKNTPPIHTEGFIVANTQPAELPLIHHVWWHHLADTLTCRTIHLALLNQLLPAAAITTVAARAITVVMAAAGNNWFSNAR